MLVRAEALGFAYADGAPIFSNCSFDLTSGFTGIVGPNGEGKTTLARLIAGELRPSEGRVRVFPEGARIAVCEQAVECMTAPLTELAQDRSRTAERLRGLLGLRAADLDRFATLSPGERKRWQIAAALGAEPDVLIADEPTNHIDADARSSLIDALRRFRGIGLLISHDRELLEALTTQTVRVHAGKAVLYSGSYEQARRTWEAESRAERDRRDSQVAVARKLARQLADERRAHASAERNVPARARARGKHDHEARTMAAKNLAAWAEDRLGRNVGKLRDAVVRAEANVSEFVVDKTLGRSIFAEYDRAPRKQLLTLVARELCRGERVLLRDVSLVLGREDRVQLAGPNGAGKTSLLTRLVGEARSDASRITYLPQELGTDATGALLARVRALPRAERGRLLGILAALGVDPERVLASPHPSPGEARKLLIASGLAAHTWALVLDEPTNHLDLPSVERLEACLAAFPGAVLIVSHDRRFAERTTQLVWRLAERRVEVESRPLP